MKRNFLINSTKVRYLLKDNRTGNDNNKVEGCVNLIRCKSLVILGSSMKNILIYQIFWIF